MSRKTVLNLQELFGLISVSSCWDATALRLEQKT